MRRKSSKDEGRASLEGIVPDTLTPEGADPSAATSYTNIKLRQSRWARAETNGWKSVAAVALIVGLCVGTMLLWILVGIGWDQFVALLGY